MSNFKGLIVWFCVTFFYLYQYVVRVAPKVMMPEIMADFGINEVLFGQFSGIYYISYSLMHIPVAIMIDRLDIKKVLPSCMFICALGLLPIVYTDNFYALLIGRFLTGFGSTAAILGVFKAVNSFFSHNIFSRMVSISVSIGLMGALYAGEPMVALKESIGYKEVLTYLAIFGFILSSITYIIIPRSEKIAKTNEGILSTVFSVMANKKFFIYCILAGLMVGPLEGFADIWGVQYLVNTQGLTEKLAGNITSMIFVGMMVGAIFVVYVADKTNSHNISNIISGLVMASLLLASMYYIRNVTWLYISMFIIGMFCSYQITAIYYSTMFLSSDTKTIGASIANMIITVFGYFFHSAIGGTFTYTKSIGWDINSAWNGAILVIPICLAIGSMGMIGYRFVSRNT